MDQMHEIFLAQKASTGPELPSMGLEQRETEQKIVGLMGPGKKIEGPVNTSGTKFRYLASGKDKILYHSDEHAHLVFMTARNSFLNQRASNLRKEIAFTQNLGIAVSEKGVVGETNLATHIVPKGTDQLGREFWTMEKAEGDLEKSIKGKDIGLTTRGSYCRQLLNGMSNLHLFGIHGDIKPENCLVYKNGTLRVADFGKGARVDGDTPIPGYEGNTRFAPPEDAKSKKGDVYGIGLCLIRILEEQFLDDAGTPIVFLNDEGKPLVPAQELDKKALAPHEKRRGIERFILEHPAFQRTCETEGTGFIGFAKCLQCRLGAKVGWDKEALQKEKDVLDNYISDLCTKIQNEKKKLLSPEKAGELQALLQSLTAIDPAERPAMSDALIKFDSIFSGQVKPEITEKG